MRGYLSENSCGSQAFNLIRVNSVAWSARSLWLCDFLHVTTHKFVHQFRWLWFRINQCSTRPIFSNKVKSNYIKIDNFLRIVSSAVYKKFPKRVEMRNWEEKKREWRNCWIMRKHFVVPLVQWIIMGPKFMDCGWQTWNNIFSRLLKRVELRIYRYLLIQRISIIIFIFYQFMLKKLPFQKLFSAKHRNFSSGEV